MTFDIGAWFFRPTCCILNPSIHKRDEKLHIFTYEVGT